MPRFKNDPDGVQITLNGTPLNTRGWQIEDMVLVDAIELARELGLAVVNSAEWSGSEMEQNLHLTSGDAREDKTAVDEAAQQVGTAEGSNEIDLGCGHQAMRPTRGPIRRLVGDPNAPKGEERSLRVPPGGTIEDGYSRE